MDTVQTYGEMRIQAGEGVSDYQAAQVVAMFIIKPGEEPDAEPSNKFYVDGGKPLTCWHLREHVYRVTVWQPPAMTDKMKIKQLRADIREIEKSVARAVTWYMHRGTTGTTTNAPPNCVNSIVRVVGRASDRVREAEKWEEQDREC